MTGVLGIISDELVTWLKSQRYFEMQGSPCRDLEGLSVNKCHLSQLTLDSCYFQSY